MLNDFYKCCKNLSLLNLYEQLIIYTKHAFLVNNGNIPKWNYALSKVKTKTKANLAYQKPYLKIDFHSKNINYELIEHCLREFMPWRKGPFQIGNLLLDSEWRGDLKWERILVHIKPLAGKIVLDVGSSNGYFTFIMALAGAKLALGIEPFLLFNYQFKIIRSFINKPPNAFVLPVVLDMMPSVAVFDTVFSMGVLYHQKDHIAHLKKLKTMLNINGELVLETLIIQDSDSITIKNSYAKMHNVYRIPSVKTLENWLLEAGFSNIRLVNVNQTSTNEQRKTSWIGGHAASLADFLNPCNSNLTIEGYPAPRRAVFICSL